MRARAMKDKINHKDFKKILIWSSMGIGNMVNFLPMLRALRDRFPNSEITLLTWSNPVIFDLIEDGLYNKIIFLNKKSRLSLWLSVFFLFLRTHDLFIVKWHNNIWVSRFIKASRKAYVIGHISSAGWKSKYDHLVNLPIKLISGKSDKEQYMNLVSSLILENGLYEESLIIPASAIYKADQILKEYGLNDYPLTIGLHLDVGLAQPYKQIGYEKWTQIIEGIKFELPDAKFILFGSIGDLLSEKISLKFKDDDCIVNLIGNLNIIETAALLTKINLLVGVDSSLKTIASALNTPSVVPYGCTDPSRAAPLDSKIDVIRIDLECSPCDVFGPTNWKKCSHHSCIKQLKSKSVIDSVAGFFKD